ncbi:MAG: ABC transporter ATP-binding protein [Eubacteriales bacterium]|nr:ABC transporter ATP-binding protein [Eubacteriales bacterium]
MEEFVMNIDIASFSYHGDCLLKDLKLDVRRGEVVLLTGLSGCGKTSLLRILSGLIPHYYDGLLKGEIKVLGRDINSFEKGALAKHVGHVFQNPRDQFFSTVAEDEVAMAGDNFGMEKTLLRRRVDNAFKTLEIEHLKRASVFEMSGGEMQKVAIAGTLVHDCDIILMDEPSASLDYQATADLTRMIARLKQYGKTILIAEHRLFYLRTLFDRMVILKDGRIEQEVARADVDESILTRYQLRCLDERHMSALRTDKPGKPLIHVENFGLYRGRRRLVEEDISFTVAENECMGVVGENGVGKTTMVKVLSGLLRAKADRISFGKRKRERMKNAYMLMQDTDCQIFFDTVENEVLDRSRMNDPAYVKEVKRVLTASDLWKKRGEHPQELSGGEKQRLSLLVAYFQEKKIIILDEPSSGLDYRRMRFAADLIREMNRRVPVILITHDLELLFHTANTVLMMSETGIRKVPLQGNEARIMNFIGIDR